MKSCLRYSMAAAWLSLALASVGAQTSAPVSAGESAPDFSGALDRIGRVRAELQARLDQQERACRRTFWVNSCLAEARERARREEEELDRQQRLVERAIRDQRDRAAVERVRGKQEALAERQANTIPGLSDQDIGQRVLQAQQERDTQARDKLEQQLRRQEAADRRHESRLASARERSERSRRGDAATADTQSSGSPPANAQSQERRP